MNGWEPHWADEPQQHPSEDYRIQWSIIYADGERRYLRMFGTESYTIVRDGAGSTPWRVYSERGDFDATFYTLAECKLAAAQNAGCAP